jgi:alcohol dehydrogenase (cytochrome c)
VRTALLVLVAMLECVYVSAQVPYQRIADASRTPADWLTYSGNYQSHRFSPLNQITRDNVVQLKPAWVYQVRLEW